MALNKIMPVKKKANNPEEKWAKRMNRHFTERNDRMANRTRCSNPPATREGQVPSEQSVLMCPPDHQTLQRKCLGAGELGNSVLSRVLSGSHMTTRDRINKNSRCFGPRSCLWGAALEAAAVMLQA